MKKIRETETVMCNNCSGKNTRIFLENITAVDVDEMFNIVKCVRCGLAFLNPRPLRKYIGKYYPSEDYWDLKADPKKAYGYLLNIFKNNINGGRVLDVGAATGLFLSNFNKKYWDVEGTDISKIAIKIAKKKYGMEIKSGDFLDIKYPVNYFDIVTFNNVLEHVYKPKETLLKVYKVLKKGGMVIINVPNLESIGSNIFKNSWYALDVPRHLYHFTPSTLEKMLTECRFANIKIRHGYFYHNFPVLFESFRRRFSPRIQMKKNADYENKYASLKKNSFYQLFKKTVVVLSKAVFIIVALLEPTIKKGEVIVLEAVK